MLQVLYGVGKATLKDYVDPTKIIGMTNLQDATVESSFATEDIVGGNKMFPIASFPKDKSLKFAGTNATFRIELMEYLEGAVVSTEKVVMGCPMEFKIPEDGIVALENTPIEGSIAVMGFKATEAEAAPTKGQFKVDTATKKVTFATEDKGKVINLYYQYEGGEGSTNYAITQTTMAKPFVLDYTLPIYNADTQIVAYMTLVMFKAKCTSGFALDTKHQTATTQKFEANAQDAQRLDGKLWDVSIAPVVVAEP